MKSKLEQKCTTKQQPHGLILFFQGINTKNLASHRNGATHQCKMNIIHGK